MALHIYLEHKVVGGSLGYGRHLYLVIREEHTSNDQLLNDLTWRQSGHIISGSPTGDLPTGNLAIDSNGIFSLSRDSIENGDYTELADRPIRDITNLLPGGVASWAALVDLATGIGTATYDYEIPDGITNHGGAGIEPAHEPSLGGGHVTLERPPSRAEQTD